jgi:hypothetical protein
MFLQSAPFVGCMPDQVFEIYEVYDGGDKRLVMTYEVPMKHSGCKV